MDYYENARHDYIQKQMYPTEHRMDYFPKGAVTGTNVKIVPKPECIPKFVSKIEGNAVEEGDRVFFEGIIDAQPHPGKKFLIMQGGQKQKKIENLGENQYKKSKRNFFFVKMKIQKKMTFVYWQ